MKTEMVGDGILLITTETNKEVADLFWYAQEFHESPVWHNKRFSRKEYDQWHNLQYGKPYHEAWGGFNVPFKSVEKAVDTLEVLDAGLSELYTLCLKHDAKYVIGMCESANTEVLNHELSHAMAALLPRYLDQQVRVLGLKRISQILEKYDICENYHSSVWLDEAVAYDVGQDSFIFTRYLFELAKSDLKIKERK